MKDYERVYIYLNRCLRVQGYSKDEMVSWVDDGEMLFQTIEEAFTYIEKKYYKNYKLVKKDGSAKVISIMKYISPKE